MKRKLLIVAGLACLPALAFGDVLFSSDMSTSTGWSVISTSADDVATFGYDYSAMNIPPSPGGGGDTLALHLAANTTDGVGGGVTVFSDMTFSGIHQLEFDVWGNFAGPAPGGGTGSTEGFGGGIGHDQTTVQRAFIPAGSGGWLGMVTDGSSTRDYRMYKDSGEQWVASGQYDVDTNNSIDPAFAVISPSVDISTVNPPAQTGWTDPGQPAFHWHHVTITVLPDLGPNGWAIFNIDGLQLGVLGRYGSAFPTSGAVSLFHSDYYGSIANQFGFSLYDNVLVTDVPEPTSLVLLALGGLALLRRR